MEVGGLPRLASWVAGFGGLVIVPTPDELVEMVKKLHAGGLKAHDEVRRAERTAQNNVAPTL